MKPKPIFTKRVLVILTCMFLATFSWLLSTLNQSFSSQFTIPVEYHNIPTDKVLMASPPAFIKLEVEGNGWNLFSLNLFKKPSLSLDLNYILDKDKLDLMENKDWLEKEFNNKIDVKRVFPSQILLVFDRKITKKLGVNLVQAISYEAGYGLSSSIKLDPDSINCSGPKSLLDSLTQVDTDSLLLQKLSKTKSLTIPLRLKGLNMTTSHKEVKVNLPIEQFTEVKRSIPIQIKGDKASQIILLEKQAQLSFQVPLSRYEESRTEDFLRLIQVSVKADAETIKEQRLMLRVDFQPSWLNFLKLETESVPYLKINSK